MELNEYKDKPFDILNETDNLPITDIIICDKQNKIKMLMKDHSSFIVFYSRTGTWFIQKSVRE